MTIDIHREEMVELRHAGKFLPEKPHLATLYRWATRGLNGVTLETVLIGFSRKRWTSKEALQRFVDAVTEARGAVAPAFPVVRSERDRAAAVRAARRELATAGA